MFKLFIDIFSIDIKIYFRSNGDWFSSVFFYIISSILFPLSIGYEFKQVSFISPCLIWISALFAILLSFNNLFRDDYNFGIFEQIILSPYSFEFLLFIKVITHWFITCVPLLIVTPFIGLIFNLSFNEIVILFLSLFFGTPALSMLGAIGVSFTIMLSNNGLLLSILILPFYIPILILGSSSVILFGEGYSVLGQLSILIIFEILIFLFSPFIISKIIKLNLLS